MTEARKADYLKWLIMAGLFINFAVNDMRTGYTNGALLDCLFATLFNLAFLSVYFSGASHD